MYEMTDFKKLSFKDYNQKDLMIKISVITILIIFLQVMEADAIQNLQRQNQSKELPEGFVYVDQVDPLIINNLRYFTTQNFIGEVLPGYYANRAILTRAAALALREVNQQFLLDGYQIVIYDTYRPQRTVNRFVQWSFDEEDYSQRIKYYPKIDKSLLFELGYIAKKSGHSRGSTIDMSIIKKGTTIRPIEERLRLLEDGRLIFWLDDGTQDMGSSFDLLDQASHPLNNTLLPKQYMKRRAYLAQKMQKHGFKGIDTQWWHFTLINEPFPNTYFDFDVR